jgi:uncharacterized radical SAM superfamily protein
VSKNKLPEPFKIFNPGREFPAISLTGKQCELDCAHCGGKYLEQMHAVSSPDELLKIATKLDQQGAIGALISGGCDSLGQVMLERYLDTFRLIKDRTSLTLNVHTGILTEAQARIIARAGIDIASIDIVGDASTIRSVYGLDHEPEAYRNTLNALDQGGVEKIVPHICVGLDFGQIKGEFNALDIITGIQPAAIVFIILIPTKGSKMEHCSPPDINGVIKLIEHARIKFKQTPLYLGCMRPRSKRFREYSHELEKHVIEIGIDGIVLPSRAAVDYLKLKKIQTITLKRCCAVV